jgi:hypothetical protein
MSTALPRFRIAQVQLATGARFMVFDRRVTEFLDATFNTEDEARAAIASKFGVGQAEAAELRENRSST